MKKCEKCGFVIIDNEEPLKVLKMLRRRENDKEKYPMLIADFYCENVSKKKCSHTKHVKWNNLSEDIEVNECPECGGKILASVFLGILKGLHIESYCFNCYNKIKSGSAGKII